MKLFVTASYSFLAVILLLLVSLSSNAQEAKEVFSLKPALGINAAQIHGDSYNGFNKAGVFAGTAVNARLSKKASLDIGFYFSQKGSRHNQNPEKGDYTFYYVNLNYLDLPLSLQYFLNKDYYITAGPGIAYLINYREYNQLGDWTNVYPFEKFEYSANFGLGKKFKEKFFVEVRTSNSFLPVRSYGVIANLVYYPNAIARMFNRGLYNNVLTFMFSYKIGLKTKQHVAEQ